MIESISNSLHEDDKITMDRIDSLKALYSISKIVSSESDSEESEESESESEESNSNEPKFNENKSNLFRRKSKTRWSGEALDGVGDEMEKQLQMLREQSDSFSDKRNKISKKSIHLSDE
eukprot:28569_1